MMTPKGAVLVSAAIASVGVGTVLRSDSLVLISVPLVAYFLLAGLMAEEPHLLVSVERRSESGKIFEGGSVEVGAILTNGAGELGLLVVEDSLPRGLRVSAGNSEGSAFLPEGSRFELRYEVASDVPGPYDIGPMVLRAYDSFGFHSMTAVIDSSFRLDVLPRVDLHRSLAFRPRRTKNWPGQVVSPRPGAGLDFYAVRQYAYGDPVRMVNWKASAKLDRMFTNQYMSELGSDAVVVVDKRSSSDFGVPPASALTYVERAAAAVSNGLLLASNRVGMIVFGEMVYKVFPATGRRQLERILLTLARSRKGQTQSIELLPEYLSLAFPRAAQPIVVSSLADPDLLVPLMRLRARQDIVVISPAFEGRREAARARGETAEVALGLLKLQRRTTLDRLRRYMTVVDWDVVLPLEAALEEALLGRQRVGSR